MDVQNGTGQFVTVENSMGVVHMSRGRLNPASNNLRSEPWIVAKLASETIVDSKIPWLKLVDDYDEIRNLIEKSIPGFEQYNQRVRSPNGFELPNPPRDKLEFATFDGKAQFSINDAPNISVPDGHFVMMTIRSHDQYNTTIYGLDDRYRGIKGNRRVLMMNANDMIDKDLKSRDLVNITSHYDNIQIKSKNWLVIPYKIPKGNIAAYFPEANELVPLESTADISNTPTSKWIVCTIGKSNSEEEE